MCRPRRLQRGILLGGPSSSHGVTIAWQTCIRHMNALIPRRKPQAAPPRRKAARPGPCRDRRDPRAGPRPLSTYAGCTILQGDRDAVFPCAGMHTSAPGAGALTHWPSVARGLASSKRRLRQVASLPPRRWPAVRHSPPPSIHGGDDPNGTY